MSELNEILTETLDGVCIDPRYTQFLINDIGDVYYASTDGINGDYIVLKFKDDLSKTLDITGITDYNKQLLNNPGRIYFNIDTGVSTKFTYIKVAKKKEKSVTSRRGSDKQRIQVF